MIKCAVKIMANTLVENAINELMSNDILHIRNVTFYIKF